MEAITPFYVINYKSTTSINASSQKNITKELSPYLEAIIYEESLENHAGSLELELYNKDGRWLDAWRPETTDEISCVLGYKDGLTLETNTFYIDEVSADGSRSSGDIFIIRAMSNTPVATHSPIQTKILERMPFKTFAQEIVDSLGMNLKGDLSGEVTAITTHTGLALLMEQGKKLGKIMKTEGNTINLFALENIKKDSYKITITKGDEVSYQMSDNAAGRYTKCECRSWNYKTKNLIKGSYNLRVNGGGTAVIWEDVKDNIKAQERAKRWLEDKNKKGVEFVIDMIGDPRLISGINVDLKGFGQYDKTYYISNSSHRYSRREGYVTSINLQL